MRPVSRPATALVAALALLGACSRPSGEEEAARRRIFTKGEARPAPPPLDPAKPLEALRRDPGELARRAGPFAWEGRATWAVSRDGGAAVKASEVHRLRQLRGGEFDLQSDIDPGGLPGEATGKAVVFTGGRTFARSAFAPFRARELDRGNEARRERDATFGVAADVLALCGPALRVERAGEASVLGRRGVRYTLALSGEAPAAPARPPGGADDDTKRRLAFLEGAVPTALEGELVLDVDSGLPLAAVLNARFTERGDPGLRADVAVDAKVTALGGDVAPVQVPRDTLADERKPHGVARALEAAGLRKGNRPVPAEDEPGDDAP